MLLVVLMIIMHNLLLCEKSINFKYLKTKLWNYFCNLHSSSTVI